MEPACDHIGASHCSSTTSEQLDLFWTKSTCFCALVWRWEERAFTCTLGWNTRLPVTAVCKLVFCLWYLCLTWTNLNFYLYFYLLLASALGGTKQTFYIDKQPEVGAALCSKLLEPFLHWLFPVGASANALNVQTAFFVFFFLRNVSGWGKHEEFYLFWFKSLPARWAPLSVCLFQTSP